MSSGALAVASAVALGPAVYQCVRALAQLRSREPDPVAIVWSERSLLLERVGVAGYVIAALVVLAAPALARRPALAPRVFEACVFVGFIAGVAGGAIR